MSVGVRSDPGLNGRDQDAASGNIPGKLRMPVRRSQGCRTGNGGVPSTDPTVRDRAVERGPRKLDFLMEAYAIEEFWARYSSGPR